MPTLTEWFDHLMQHEWNQVRISTQERRLVDYDARLRQSLGTQRLDRLTAQVVKRWLYDHIDREGNRRCIQNAHNTLVCMIAIAVREKLLPVNTAKAVRYPIEGLKTKPHRVLHPEQYQHLLTCCRTREQRLVIRILGETALRRSEHIEIQLGDLDLTRQYLNVNRRVYVTRNGIVNIDTGMPWVWWTPDSVDRGFSIYW